MTKSTITRERLAKIKSWRETYGAGSNVMLPAEEAEELARIALAAMDSEPDRNPVLAYADSYRDMAKQGVESVPIWSVITDLERNIAPLYRHAQQPVVPEEWTIADAVKFCKETGRQDAGSAMDAWNACRAAMLQTKSLTSINPAPDLVSLQKKAESIIGNYPGIPDCWCRTCRPVVLNDMRFVVCPDCGNKRCPRANDHRNACTGSNEPGQEGIAYPDTIREVK
ncbi:hypothetical protein [Klebsiella pneumoniae]|uniref:hypothetical protein n=1 Tax=Klebsiella pneumoniae TaxID=573 RepID=UPI000A887423|nr:hypothetical protein [Klebsiella pneumoniae]